MTDLLVLSDDEVRGLLPLGELAEAVREALVSLSEGNGSVPPRIGAHAPNGLLGAMPGYVPGAGLAAKLVSIYPRNPERGVPAHHALIAVFDESTGAPAAVMGATYITAVRTAVTSTLAAQALAPPGRRRVAILGSGVQAAAHLAAVSGLMDGLEEIRISSRDSSRASLVAANDRRAVVTNSARDAVEGADVVLCCTDSPGPVLFDGWVRPGAHVGSVGLGAELPSELLDRASIFVESSAAALPPPGGAAELQSRDPLALTEIGAVLGGHHAGRTGPDEVTVFKSIGHAAEDVAAAAVVLRHAVALGTGTNVRFS